jgi:CrcB protein
MQKILILVAGGAFGTFARYVVSGVPYKFSYPVFPWGTFLVNTIGAFLIGLFWGIFEIKNITPEVRAFIFIGFLGGFTTFSTYALETMNFFKTGDIKMAILNILANNIRALVLVLAGFWLSREFINFLK